MPKFVLEITTDHVRDFAGELSQLLHGVATDIYRGAETGTVMLDGQRIGRYFHDQTGTMSLGGQAPIARPNT